MIAVAKEILGDLDRLRRYDAAAAFVVFGILVGMGVGGGRPLDVVGDGLEWLALPTSWSERVGTASTWMRDPARASLWELAALIAAVMAAHAGGDYYGDDTDIRLTPLAIGAWLVFFFVYEALGSRAIGATLLNAATVLYGLAAAGWFLLRRHLPKRWPRELAISIGATALVPFFPLVYAAILFLAPISDQIERSESR